MNHKIGIFYFSGTGNTRILSEKFNDYFIKYGHCSTLIKIEDYIHGKSVTEDYDYIGLGFPVHAFNAPRIVYKFLKMLPSNNKTKVFIFKTAGSILFEGGPNSILKRMLNSKGYKVIYEDIFIISSNIFSKYPDELVLNLYNASIIKMETMAKNILSGKSQKQSLGIFISILSICISALENLGSKMLKFHFSIDKNCTKCYKCIKSCPQKNIYATNEKIKFKYNCIFCLKCIYNCPECAIKIPPFNFAILKDYNIYKTLENPFPKKLPDSYYTDSKYSHLINYINDSYKDY